MSEGKAGPTGGRPPGGQHPTGGLSSGGGERDWCTAADVACLDNLELAQTGTARTSSGHALPSHEQAWREIRGGAKTGHWIWCVGRGG